MLTSSVTVPSGRVTAGRGDVTPSMSSEKSGISKDVSSVFSGTDSVVSSSLRDSDVSDVSAGSEDFSGSSEVSPLRSFSKASRSFFFSL